MAINTRTLRDYFSTLVGGAPASVVGADLTVQNLSNFATAAQGALAETALQEVVPGDSMTVDASDPVRPIVSLDAAGVTSLGKADTAVQSIVAGANVAVDNTDPQNPIVSSAGGGGGGTVSSVGLIAPTGFDVAGSPVTIAGNITLSYAAGYQGFLTAQATKVDFLTVTQAVDLDTMESTVATLVTDLNTAEADIVALDGRVDTIEAAGYVVGPASSVDNTLPRFDSTTGKLIQASGVVVDDSDRMLFGTTTAQSFLSGAIVPKVQANGLSASDSTVAAFRWNAGATAPSIFLAKSRGSTVGTRGIVSSGDPVGRLTGYADDGVDFVPSAEIMMSVDGTPGVNDMPGRITFLTCADGSATLTERMRISSAGLTTITGTAYITGTLDLGNASDTTLSRSAAGRLAVEGNDVALLSVADQTVTGGARITILDLGNLSGASITPDPGDRPTQKITNNGAGSILPGSNHGSYRLLVINTTGAGTITTTGWTLKGDSFDTTTTSKFLCSGDVYADMAVLNVQKIA